jgi:hypothetical protein
MRWPCIFGFGWLAVWLVGWLAVVPSSVASYELRARFDQFK